MSNLNQMLLTAARLLVPILILVAPSGFARAQEPVSESPLPAGLETQLEQLGTQAEGLEAEGREEAAAEHYQEALDLFRRAKALLNQRESMLKEAAREAIGKEVLTRLTGELEKNAKWLGEVEDMLNLLKLSL